ncbi:hypothetical protein D3C71_1756860 [compost metagenome]
MIQQMRAVRPLPAHLRGREMHADIAQCQRTEHGIAQGVQDHVAIAVREHAAAVRDADAAEHDVIALAKGMDVVALSDAEGRKLGRGHCKNLRLGVARADVSVRDATTRIRNGTGQPAW